MKVGVLGMFCRFSNFLKLIALLKRKAIIIKLLIAKSGFIKCIFKMFYSVIFKQNICGMTYNNQIYL